MRDSDPDRYERIPGSARRYLDVETGESISRREYDKRTKDDDDDDDYYLDVISAGGSTRE